MIKFIFYFKNVHTSARKNRELPTQVFKNMWTWTNLENYPAHFWRVSKKLFKLFWKRFWSVIKKIYKLTCFNFYFLISNKKVLQKQMRAINFTQDSYDLKLYYPLDKTRYFNIISYFISYFKTRGFTFDVNFYL